MLFDLAPLRSTTCFIARGPFAIVAGSIAVDTLLLAAPVVEDNPVQQPQMTVVVGRGVLTTAIGERSAPTRGSGRPRGGRRAGTHHWGTGPNRGRTANAR